MYYLTSMDFSQWVVGELEKRGWSRSEAARRGGISSSMFDKVINGHAKPGVKFIEGIAQAFKMSPADVMMRLKKQNTEDPWVEEMSHKLTLLSPGLRSIAEVMINALAEGDESSPRKAKPSKTKPSTS